ncbi:hypothetical protein AMATHDRAFT_4113 [Amanita thiersii Skay4041]|uniref:ubiquitinyl hydrolase 1 n=1 Tax=Amanita thiersii Skay4041 TaxID=703135 RepID=A0A2A9NH20_9AGAR|nr:hypothetical protein AMATHDRAFT_4113 [Amanita thiersii Skay4041]
MPGVTITPSSPNAGSFGPSSSALYLGMSVAEIKAKAKEAVSKDARGVSAMTLIKTARSQIVMAQDYESRGELKSALSAYIKAASLATMTLESSEYFSERGKSGMVRKELNDFMEKHANVLNARANAIEEMLKTSEKQSQEDTHDPKGPITKTGGSIQDRLRALESHGMDITAKSSKRSFRDSLNQQPTSPVLAKRFSNPPSNIAVLSALSPPASISTASSQHTVVSPSSLGPPSPSSSPSSSPLMSNLDISGFSRAFPTIDELNGDLNFSLPSVPTGTSIGSVKSSPRHAPVDEPPPAIPTIGEFAVPFERPSSTPITPLTTNFVSRPTSPSKNTAPIKSSGLSASMLSKSPIPVSNSATAKELLNYIRDYNVLLIDVRNRDEFEQEHIKADAIVCIEPTVLLRENVTEQMLEDAMVIAPKQEQSLFMNRDKFDLVAVYDNNSTTFGAPTGPLQVLVRAIKEQAFKKMLKRMPMMLMGGIAAWKHEFGDSEVVKGYSSLSSLQSPKPTQSLNSETLVNGNTSTPMFTPSSPSHNGFMINGNVPHSPLLAASTSSSSSITQSQIPPRSPFVSHPQPGDHRTQFSVDYAYGHNRSPAEFSYPSSPFPNDARNGLARRPAISRPSSNSVSYTRSTLDSLVNGHASINGATPVSPITYPSVSRRISPAMSGSNSTSPIPPQIYHGIASPTIASPPQASINASHISRRRGDFVDQSQEALSNLNDHRPPIDYPEIPGPQIPRPPPAAALSGLERQDKRAQHMPHPAPQPHSAGPKPPRIPSDYPVTFWFDMQVGTSGLKNLGNTCYMNAPIQCLSATVPFARFFTEGRWKHAINFCNPLGYKGKLTDAFAKLVQEMWHADFPYLTPIEFRKNICQLKSEFIGNDQHDSQEFLSFLLDGIHEDLNRVIYKPPVIQSPEQEAELERLPPQIASEQEWQAWKTRNDSLIVDFFQGQFRSRLECLTCRKTSTTYNVFSILQLPVPHAKTGKIPIQRCLDAFFNEEILEKDDSWDCPQCKAKRRATKKLSLARLPPILLIQLKRFEANGRFSDKIDTFVDYPTKSLDLTNYMPPPLPPGVDKKQLNGGAPMSPDDPRTQLPPYRYELYAVTNHYGNLSSGHYTAFIASRGGWMYCDDSSVKPVDPKQVVV